jgi:phosphonate transport system permease protein
MRTDASRWDPPPLIANPLVRFGVYAGAAIYLFLALNSIDINWTRVAEGAVRAGRLFSGFLHPDFVSRWGDVWDGLLESLTMTVTATLAGILLSIPFGIGAARNVAPLPVYLFCRGFIAVSRSLQEIIIAIFLVVLFGFGPFAGFLTLTFASIGFLGKLLAEDIEDTDPAPLEAIRATGAGWFQLLVYAVLPQVAPRLIGLSMYRIDINFRESAVLGIVGAGGIGATLNTAMDRYEFDSAAAILLIIIGIVLACEYSSSFIRSSVK